MPGRVLPEYLRRARPHVSRVIPEVTGMSARDFLRARQLAHAQLLLRTTPASVEQIALASGFGTGGRSTAASTPLSG